MLDDNSYFSIKNGHGRFFAHGGQFERFLSIYFSASVRLTILLIKKMFKWKSEINRAKVEKKLQLKKNSYQIHAKKNLNNTRVDFVRSNAPANSNLAQFSRYNQWRFVYNHLYFWILTTLMAIFADFARLPQYIVYTSTILKVNYRSGTAQYIVYTFTILEVKDPSGSYNFFLHFNFYIVFLRFHVSTFFSTFSNDVVMMLPK